MQLLLKAAVAAHVVARALLLVMLLLIPGLSTKEWCGRPIWRELSMPSGWEAAVAVASTAESRIPQNRVEMEDMWPLEVCTDDGLRIRAAGPAAFLRGVRHDIMSVWCKEGATVWIENGSNRDRHSATIKANITEGDDDVQIAWTSTGAIDTVPKSTVHQHCVDGGRRSRSRRAPQWFHAKSDDHKKESGKAARFVVESILDSKMSEGGELFLVHWKGYGKDKDSWEPAGNIAVTGHIDTYKRECKCKSKSLKAKVGTERVVIVEYQDGMQDTIDLAEETFRRPPEDGGGGANDFSLVEENAVIELLWPHAQRYYPCRIISCRSVV